MPLYQELFDTLTSQQFLEFATLNIRISSDATINLDNPFFLEIEESNSSHLSNICITQYDRDISTTIAWFYSHYNYIQALALLLNDENSHQQFRLELKGVKKDLVEDDYRTYHLNMKVCIEKSFLLELYNLDELPQFIYLILTDLRVVNSIPINLKCLPIINPVMTKTYKRELFPYQKQNIQWMLNLERLITENEFYYDAPYVERPCREYFIKDLNDSLVFNTQTKKMINPNDIYYNRTYFQGGVLADDIGLGKTFSMIGLIKEAINEHPSLIICPRRLCCQWKEEIESSCELRTTIISTITQFKKLTIDKLNSLDVVIISYNFLSNAKYMVFKQENWDKPDTLILEKFLWERVILDEGHEYVHFRQTKKPIREIHNELNKFQPKFKWVCSGTPFRNIQDLMVLLNFLSANRDWSKSSQYSNHNIRALDMLVRKNTGQNTEGQVSIPPPEIGNEFLEMTTIERAIYDSALGDREKMFELCNHALVSDQHIQVLGNQPIPLEEIHKKMTEYYQKKVKYLETRLKNTEKSILEEPNNNELIEVKDNLRQQYCENQQKLNIFLKLNDKIKEENQCPICFEEFQGKIKTVTPCGHIFCGSCIQLSHTHSQGSSNKKVCCPYCRHQFSTGQLQVIRSEASQSTQQLGTKMSRLIDYCRDLIQQTDNRIIIFSQWDNMLKLVCKVLVDSNINHLVLNGSMHVFNNKVRKFKLDESVRIVLLSMEKNVSGLTLTEANHIILLDSFNADKKTCQMVEQQAIGRAVRIGQEKRVQVKRFIMRDTIEETSFNLSID